MAVVLWGTPAILVLLLALPVITETLREAWLHAAAAVFTAALAAACWWKLPMEALPLAWGWCTAAVVMLGVRWRWPQDRSVLWGGLCVVAVCVGLLLLGWHYPGLICDGLAEDAVRWINQRKDAASILLRAYQSGLAGLEEDLAARPAIQLFGMVIMPGDVRLELLKGLRTSIAILLETWLPRLIVDWIGLTMLLCAVAPEAYRRRQGGRRRLTAFEKWRVPEQLTLLMVLLMIGGVMSYMATSRVTAQAFSMSGEVFRDVYLLMGMCTVSFMMKARGSQQWTRRLVLAAGVVLLPSVLVIIGLADQAFNLRKPRR